MAQNPKIEDLDITDELIAERRHGPIEVRPDDMPSWVYKTITRIDLFSLWIGRIVCLLTLPLCFVMVYEVIVRYAFVAPTMWAYDLSRFFYGALFMLGAGYALSKGVHIRADFLYRTWSQRTQGWVDATLYLVFYFPGMAVFLWMATDFASLSWIRGERGMDTAWMPYMGPIKTALPLGVLFLLIQGVSEFLKSWYAATRGRWP
jgi:TRAP-type mannitol/chloroaromatic compound transport system permease small subunit